MSNKIEGSIEDLIKRIDRMIVTLRELNSRRLRSREFIFDVERGEVKCPRCGHVTLIGEKKITDWIDEAKAHHCKKSE